MRTVASFSNKTLKRSGDENLSLSKYKNNPGISRSVGQRAKQWARTSRKPVPRLAGSLLFERIFFFGPIFEAIVGSLALWCFLCWHWQPQHNLAPFWASRAASFLVSWACYFPSPACIRGINARQCFMLRSGLLLTAMLAGRSIISSSVGVLRCSEDWIGETRESENAHSTRRFLLTDTICSHRNTLFSLLVPSRRLNFPTAPTPRAEASPMSPSASLMVLPGHCRP